MTLEEDIKEIKQILSEIRDNNLESVKTNTEIADSLRIFREFVLEVTPEQAKKEIKDSE
tara:strand:+ start:120 stop:296 length:177 start_codon:yes stop_codon:yes gene_type:complete